MSSYEITIEEDQIVVELGNSGGIAQASLGKAGRVAIGTGQESVSVSFVTALTTAVTTFSLQVSLMNLSDSFPQFLSVQVTSFTVNGFTATLNAATDTGNYILNWSVLPSANG